MKKMIITIHKDGTQKVEVVGAVGDACVELTHQLENRLGVQVGERTLKPEYELEEETEAEVDFEVER